MKKLWTLFSVICLVISVPVFAEEESVTSDDYKYALLEDGTADAESTDHYAADISNSNDIVVSDKEEVFLNDDVIVLEDSEFRELDSEPEELLMTSPLTDIMEAKEVITINGEGETGLVSVIAEDLSVKTGRLKVWKRLHSSFTAARVICREYSMPL